MIWCHTDNYNEEDTVMVHRRTLHHLMQGCDIVLCAFSRRSGGGCIPDGAAAHRSCMASPRAPTSRACGLATAVWRSTSRHGGAASARTRALGASRCARSEARTPTRVWVLGLMLRSWVSEAAGQTCSGGAPTTGDTVHVWRGHSARANHTTVSNPWDRIAFGGLELVD